MRLFQIVRSKIDEQFLNAFKNTIAFILNIKNYFVSICICIEIFSILRYKVNNIRSTLNELRLYITELKDAHERNENRICLKYWRKMIFLTSTVLESLLLLSCNKIIMNQEVWTFSAVIRKNNRFFHKKIIKNYISMIIERLVNAFNEFMKNLNKSIWRSSTLIFIETLYRILLLL